MPSRGSSLRAAGPLLGATLALPALGALAAGRDLGPLLSFPPEPRPPPGYVHFSWPFALLLAAPAAALAGSWIRRGAAGPAAAPPPLRPFPPWGWAALAWTGCWWALAWSRFPWFAPLQPFTFLPLWLGFIAAASALAWRRGAARPRRLPALFAASAGFWWVFEWLDRFTGNWRYLGVERFGPVGYALHATLCFSTVLPAVAAARGCLGTLPRWNARLRRGPAAPWLLRPAAGRLLGAAGLAGLFLAGARPAEAYPALWAAPLALAFAAGILGRRPGVWAELAAGDWRSAGSWAAAGLLCGFFWELWNSRSLAHWAYAVPYADRWHLFALPALGYLGYLPFGLECLLACALLGADG